MTLTLTRRNDQSLRLKCPGVYDVLIRIHSIKGASPLQGSSVKISIDAPPTIAIIREEIADDFKMAPLVALTAEQVAQVRDVASRMIAARDYRMTALRESLHARGCTALAMATQALLDETDDLPLNDDALRGFVDRFQRRNPHLFRDRGPGAGDQSGATP